MTLSNPIQHTRWISLTWIKRIALLTLALPALLPLLWLSSAWLSTDADSLWPHLQAVVLPPMLRETALLLLGTAFIAGFLGLTLGLLQARYEYPGRRIFDVLLLLPLSLPAYVTAFVWIGGSEYASNFAQYWRLMFGEAVIAPSVRGVWGGVFVFGLGLFPYVYALVRLSARQLPQSLIDSAHLLQLNSSAQLRLLYLPQLWPALALGLSLVLMETLADYGAAALLGVETLTTGVYKTWLGLQSLTAAAQLASLAVGIVLLLLLLEQRARLKLSTASKGSMQRVRLKPNQAVLVWIMLIFVMAFSFGIPTLQLLIWALHSAAQVDWHALILAALDSALLAAMAAALVVSLGLVAALLQRGRTYEASLALWSIPLGIGYAVPGTVLAVAILLLLGSMGSVGRWLSVSIAALLLAYLARFARMGFTPLQNRLQQLAPSVPDAARGLGLGAFARFRTLYAPLLLPSAFTAATLVFVETLKELPATLVLRPLGWDTLAIKVYGYTSEGLWQQAALPALFLVAVSLVPVFLLARSARD
jgi:iron(III) transport system permease protein